MSNAQHGNETRNPTRLVAVIFFMLMVVIGYAVSPRVEGSVGRQNPVMEEDAAEEMALPSECTSGGLVFGDCDLDF